MGSALQASRLMAGVTRLKTIRSMDGIAKDELCTFYMSSVCIPSVLDNSKTPPTENIGALHNSETGTSRPTYSVAAK